MANKDTLYARWLAGNITEEEKRQLKQSGEWHELSQLIKATDELLVPVFDVDAAYQQSLKSRQKKLPKSSSTTGNQDKTKVKTINHYFKWIGAIAAVCVLCLAAFLLLRDTSTQIAANPTNISTHQFADNSKVILNDGSSITYEEANWNSARNVQLKGEAFFEVEKGAPFTVATPVGKVAVLGTQFNVRAWGNQMYIECYEGKVKVSPIALNKSTILIAGQSVMLEGKFVDVPKPIQHTEPFWTKGIARFYEEDLNTVLQEIERQYGVTVKSSTFNRQFSGSFNHHNLSTALEQVCKPMGLKFQISDNKKVVTISQ